MKLPIKQTTTETLSGTLGTGNSTSGEFITISNGDYIEFPGAAQAAATGQIRIAQGFTFTGRDVANSNDRILINWTSDDFSLGHASHDTNITGLSLVLKGLTWPNSDGTTGQVISTNGAGVLGWSSPVTDHGGLSGLGDDDHNIYILVDGTRNFTGTVGGITPTQNNHLTTKFYVDQQLDGYTTDHGELNGLGDDDHTIYLLAETTITDNALVRWDTNGRQVQNSGIIVDDSNNTSGFATITVSGAAASTGRIRLTHGDSVFGRNSTNSNNSSLISWGVATNNTLAVGDPAFSTRVLGDSVRIQGIAYPNADGSSGYVMSTNGAGTLSLVDINTLSIDTPNLFDVLTAGNDANGLGAHNFSFLEIDDATDGYLDFNKQGSNVNEGRWRIYPGSTGELSKGTFEIASVADNGTLGETAIQIVRNGTTITRLELHADVIDFNSNELTSIRMTSGGDITNARYIAVSGSSVTGFITLEDTGAGTNEQVWKIFADGTLYIQTRTDGAGEGGGTGNDALWIERTGTTVDEINLGAPLDMNSNAINSAAIITGQAYVASTTTPYYLFNETDAGTDSKNWRFRVGGSTFSFQTLDDSLTPISDIYTIGRVGTTPTAWEFNVSIDMNGNDISGVDDLELTGTGPQIDFNDTDGTTDGKRWRIATSGDDFIIQMRNDANSSITDAISIRRTGSTLDEIEMFGQLDMRSNDITDVDTVNVTLVNANRSDTVGVATPAWGATTNNYALAADITIIRPSLSGGPPNNLTGIAGGTDGRHVYILDPGGGTLALLHGSGSSSAGNRFSLPGLTSYTLAAGEMIHLIYVDTLWRLVSN